MHICKASPDNTHLLQKLGVRLVTDRMGKQDTLDTFSECVHCGKREMHKEVFYLETVNMWIASEQGNIPNESIFLENMINGKSDIYNEMGIN